MILIVVNITDWSEENVWMVANFDKARNLFVWKLGLLCCCRLLHGVSKSKLVFGPFAIIDSAEHERRIFPVAIIHCHQWHWWQVIQYFYLKKPPIFIIILFWKQWVPFSVAFCFGNCEGSWALKNTPKIMFSRKRLGLKQIH